MSSGEVQRTKFFACRPEQSPRDFIAEACNLTPCECCSVAVLLLTPDFKEVALVLPRKVEVRQRSQMARVPIQGRMEVFTRGVYDPQWSAKKVLETKLGLVLTAESLQYVGYGFTHQYKSDEVCIDYGKMLHFCLATIPRASLPPNSKYASLAEWHRVDRSLDAVTKSVMSFQKRRLFSQALQAIALRQHAATPYLSMATKG